MAVRQFNRKRRARNARVQAPALPKTAARKLVARQSAPLKSSGVRGQSLAIPKSAGRRKSIDGQEAAGAVLEATQSFAAALLDVETLMWTVHRGHAKAIKNLSAVARAVLRAATELKRTLR